MPRPGISWLLVVALLGGLMPPSTSLAQNEPESTLTLELLRRIEQLEGEVRQIRGELEIYRHRLEQLQAENRRAYTPPTSEYTPPTSPPGAATLPASAPPVAPNPPAKPPTATSVPATTQMTPPTAAGTAQADFDAAIGEFREGRYGRAIAGFQKFLNAYPNSDQADDAQYWLGESYYLSRDYSAAKEAFINLGVHHPESTQLPNALLKLGYIYGVTGETTRAREVLQKLIQTYPDTQAASLAERRLQTLH